MHPDPAFKKLLAHPIYGKMYLKLNGHDRAFIAVFTHKNWPLTKDNFEFKVNRLFLDQENKPKDYTKIMEILSAFNGIRFQNGGL